MKNFEILENKEKNGVEIYFSTIPTREIINNLKASNFRWHSGKKCWYAKATATAKALIESLGGEMTITASEKSCKQEIPQSELKYLLNGIKDKNGKYYACYYNFDNITLEIQICHKEYGDLPTPTNTKGIRYKDDTDMMADYFCKPSLYIAPTSKEYAPALETLKQLQEKRKNYSFTLEQKTLEQIEQILTAKEEEKENIYNNIIKQNTQEEQERQEQEKREETKNCIKRLQGQKQEIEQGKYSYYDKIIENENSITAISKNEYYMIDFTPNCLNDKKVDYTIIKIDKNNLTRESKTLTAEEYEKFLQEIA